MRKILSSLFFVIVVGCGSAKSSGDKNASIGQLGELYGSISKENAQLFLLGYQDQLAGMSAVRRTDIDARLVSKPAGCESTDAGDRTDADGDGFPVEDNRTFNCYTGGPSVDSKTVTGRIILKDLDDHVPTKIGGWGYTFEEFSYLFENEDRNVINRSKIDGTWTMSTDDKSIYLQTQLVMSSGTQAPGIERDVEAGFQLSIVSAPHDMQLPEASGTAVYSGFVSFKSTGGSDPVFNADAGLTVISENLFYKSYTSLEYPDDCTLSQVLRNNGFYAGKILLTDAAGNSISLTYEGCLVQTFYNGEPIGKAFE